MEEGQQTIWNIDGAELALIFEIKVEAGSHLKNWNLEGAYWSLRDFRREIDAKLNREKKENVKIYGKDDEVKDEQLTEKEVVNIMLQDCENERNKFLKSDQDMDDLSSFYLILEQFYLHLSFLMKKHGLYLREGDDPSEAFRRR